MLPDIMSWPRGSNIRPVRIQSNSARKCWRRTLMHLPSSSGPPPETTRTGLPQVWASMQEKVYLDICDLVPDSLCGAPPPTSPEDGGGWGSKSDLVLQRVADFGEQDF